jgi:hypothetical protein
MAYGIGNQYFIQWNLGNSNLKGPAKKLYYPKIQIRKLHGKGIRF